MTTNAEEYELLLQVKTVLTPDRKTLVCSCGAQSGATSKERARFLRRHPAICGGKAAERQEKEPAG
jgi:hypothetical protein